MEIIGYGEDALTLWALTHRLKVVLDELGDSTSADSITVFFRPSFGRRGGPERSEFGEFDFILLTEQAVYLGESKWHRSSEDVEGGRIKLREEQWQRHQILKWYIEEWVAGGFSDWGDFFEKKGGKLTIGNVTKPLPPKGSLLSENLSAVLSKVGKRFPGQTPSVRNVLLYFYVRKEIESLPLSAGEDFTLVTLDYSDYREANFIRLGQIRDINI